MARNINATREIAINFKTNAKETADALNDVISKLDDTSQEYTDATVQLQKYEQAVEDLEAALNSTNTSQEQLLNLTEKANLEAKRSTTIVNNHSKSINKQAGETKSLTKEVTTNGGAMAILDTITGGLASTTRDALEATTLFTTGTSASTIAQRAYTFVVGTSTGALKAFRIALAATGIGLAVVAVIALVQAYQSLTGATDEATEAQRKLNAEMANNRYEETISQLEFLAEVRKEKAREQGASIAEIRELERQASQERLNELDKQRRDENLTSEQVKKAGEAYLAQQRKIVLQEARWRADDAESARNTAKQTANVRTKISKDNSAELKRIEEERINFLKKIDIEYTRWLEENSNVNPTTGMINKTKNNIKDLEAARKADLESLKKDTTLLDGEYSIRENKLNEYYDFKIKKEQESLTNFENIISQETELLKRINRLDTNILYDSGIEELNQDIFKFIENIKDADLKQFYEEAFNVDGIKEIIELTSKYPIQDIDKFELLDFDMVDDTISKLDNVSGVFDLFTKNQISQATDMVNALYIANTIRLAQEEDFMLKQLDDLNASEEEKQKIRDSFTLRRVQNEEEAAKALNDIDKERFQQSVTTLYAFSDALGATAELMGEHTAGYKTLAIAQTTIDTYTSAMSAYKGMVQAIPGPVGIAAGAAAAAASVLTGYSNVKKILAVKTPGGSSGGGSVPSAAGAVPNVSFVSSSENQIANSVTGAMNNQNQEPIKAYVVSSDVSSGQALERNKIESNSI